MSQTKVVQLINDYLNGNSSIGELNVEIAKKSVNLFGTLDDYIINCKTPEGSVLLDAELLLAELTGGHRTLESFREGLKTIVTLKEEAAKA